MKDPRPTTDLGDKEAWPFEDDADEVTIRVSRYQDDGKTPSAFQAVVKNRNRKLVWGVGVMSNPVQALERAMAAFYEGLDREWPSGGEHGAKREPILDDDIDMEDLLGD